MENIYKEYYQKLIIEASQIRFKNQEKFLAFKKTFCGKNKIPQPTNADLREIYDQLIITKKINRNITLEKSMLSRAIRTQSGVAVVAVLTKPSACPGKCVFCPTEKNMPKSYLSNEPAVMRAIMNKFDPYNQVQSRLRALELNGHSIEKIELIVMGGTFSYFPKSYQKKFITGCFRACNDYNKKLKAPKACPVRDSSITGVIKSIKSTDEHLKTEQRKNETAKYRIVGLTLETRPDYIDEKEILNFRNLGCTRVELGIQSIYDDVLIKNNRGHLVLETIRATKLLKDAGFKINYHMMPGLWGSSPKKDFQMFEELFSNPNFQPDMLKIYPTVVTKNSELYTIWKNGDYKALTDHQFQNLIIKIKNEIIPPYTRIQRLIRDVPLPSIEAGPTVSNLRQIIEKETHCQCIRCREIKGEYKSSDLPAMLSELKGINSHLTSKLSNVISNKNNLAMQAGKIVLDRIDYNASDGKEIFLQYVSPDKQKLYSMLRLRIPSDNNHNHFIPALENSALIREVHTYGKLINISKKDDNSLPADATTLQAGPQHIGLGKKLLQEAEHIAREEFNLKKIAVISGVGVRNYYRKNGYKFKDTYMIKSL